MENNNALQEKIQSFIIDKIDKTSKKKTKENTPKSITQREIAKILAVKFGMNISEIERIIEEEQKLTMMYVSKGCKVIKKNYLTIKQSKMKARKVVCPLDNKTYDIPEKIRIVITAGEGFKKFTNNEQMTDKLCRFTSKK